MAAGDSDFGAVGGVPDRGYPDLTLDGVREVQGIRFRRVRVQGTRVPLLPKVRSRALAGRIAMFAGTRVPLLPKVRSRALAGLASRIAMLAGTRVPLLPKVRSRALAGLAGRIAMLASLDATRSGALVDGSSYVSKLLLLTWVKRGVYTRFVRGLNEVCTRG